jgi:hypothetical protein
VTAGLRSVSFTVINYGTISEGLHQCVRKNGRDLKSVPISIFDVYEAPTDDLTRFGDLDVIDCAISRSPTEERDTILRWLDANAMLLTGSVRSSRVLLGQPRCYLLTSAQISD